ncbi:MAG: DUF1329 domain-containing protein [Proteobacteria bacterium]|nr:DUF1329 domain-containing protein [Pseudomonadota bacterium]
MVKQSKLFIIMILMLAISCGVSFAKVSQEEAAKLGNEMTPVGAIKAGNADGTIPEWTGGYTGRPPGYVKGKTLVDPFKDDKVLFTITAQNYEQYKDKLSEGLIAMFKAYPETFKMNVYPTRRSANFPEYVYKAVKENAVNAEVNLNDYNSKGWTIAVPFPIPQNGVECLMNHLMAFVSPTGCFQSITKQAIMGRGGDFTLTKMSDVINRPFNVEGSQLTDIYTYFRQETLAPPRQAGRILIVNEYIDMLNSPRQAWIYNPGQRRVRRAPTVAYDGPGTASDGLRTTDDYTMFNGPPDRYDVTLLGKKEIYVPYNCYSLKDPKVSYEDILRPFHLNPDYVRFELHRVWVIEMKLKEGMRHIYKTRRYYQDEDSWAFLLAEAYDERDQLWRVSLFGTYEHYEVPNYTLAGVNAWYDLLSRRYLAFGIVSGEEDNFTFDQIYDPEEFTPSSLRRTGVR